MDLPTAAASVYQTWWSFANYAASSRDQNGAYSFTVADAQSAASQVNRDVYGGAGGYNPIGISQLFGIARRIANSSAALGQAAPTSPITPSMVAEAPWSRSQADQAAMPMWQARVEITYTDAAGVTQNGISVVNISQVLPSSVASLNAQLALRIQDQLAAPPGTGTPRQGELNSINSITLLAV